jgi:type VI secretion system protein
MDSSRGLLDRLQRRERGTDPIQSIVAHLRVLLNARPGISSTVPDYGVVDFNDVVHTLPDGVVRIASSIRSAIEIHEPRLKNVTVRPLPPDDALTLRFEIVARVADDRRQLLRLRSFYRPGGLFTVDE